MGDLSENADYQNAKTDSKQNEARINEIKTILASSEISSDKPMSNRIGFNTMVIVKDNCNQLKLINVVGNEVITNPINIGLSSLIAKEFLFKKRGDKVMILESGILNIYTIIFLL